LLAAKLLLASYIVFTGKFSFKEGEDNTLKHLETNKCIYINLQSFSSAEIRFIHKLKEYWLDRKSNSRGKFEGLNLTDEEIANDLLKFFNTEYYSGWRLETSIAIGADPKFNVEEKIKHACKKIDEKVLWWNPNGLTTIGYIQSRKLTCTSKKNEITQDQLASINEPFIWVESSPGMGKTVLSIQVEEEWRKKHPCNRIVARLEGSQIQNQQILKDIEAVKENTFVAGPFLQKFAPFLEPTLNALSGLNHASIDVFVLFDGLDEIKAEKYNVMADILRSLSLSKKEAEKDNFRSHVLHDNELQEPLNVERVFVTARDQIRPSLKLKSRNDPYRLVPFQERDQIEYLTEEIKELIRNPEIAKKELMLLQPTLQTLIETPLTLYMLAYFIRWKGKGCSSGVLNIFNLYERFVEAHYSRYISKIGIPGSSNSVRKQHEEELYASHLPYYYNATLAIMRPNQQAHWPSVGLKPDDNILDELKKIGLVQERNNQIMFAHFSFAEFFYARMVCVKDTSTMLGNSVLRHINSDWQLNRVENFICAFFKNQIQLSSRDIGVNISSKCLDNFCDNRKRWEKKFVNASNVSFLFVLSYIMGLFSCEPTSFYSVVVVVAFFVDFALVVLCILLAMRRLKNIYRQHQATLHFCFMVALFGLFCCLAFFKSLNTAASQYCKRKKDTIAAIYLCISYTAITSLMKLWFKVTLRKEMLARDSQVVLAASWMLIGVTTATITWLGLSWYLILATCLFGIGSSLIVHHLDIIIQFFTRRKTNESKCEVLKRFVRSELFPLVGFQVLSTCIKLENVDLLEVIIDEAGRKEGNLARIWLARRDFDWVFKHLLKMSSVKEKTLSDRETDLAAKILCSDFDYLCSKLNSKQISLCLRRSKNISRIISECTISQEEREKIKRYLKIVLQTEVTLL